MLAQEETALAEAVENAPTVFEYEADEDQTARPHRDFRKYGL